MSMTASAAKELCLKYTKANILKRAVKGAVMYGSRTKKLDHFYSLYKGGSVLDVGVGGGEALSAVNLFLNTFRYPGRFYTGLGIDNLTEVAARHSDKRFVQYPGGTFPFGDNEFDWVFSNAVIEHVGNEDAQLQFVKEMLRVGKNLFFTTPNKYFPLEAHAEVLFLHWYDELFYRWCVHHKPRYNRSNLYLFSYRRLNSLMRRAHASQYKIYRNRFFGWTMTFTVVAKSDNITNEGFVLNSDEHIQATSSLKGS